MEEPSVPKHSRKGMAPSLLVKWPHHHTGHTGHDHCCPQPTALTFRPQPCTETPRHTVQVCILTHLTGQREHHEGRNTGAILPQVALLGKHPTASACEAPARAQAY